MLVTEPEGHGFKPGQERWNFLMAVKISNTISFAGEVKLSVPCQQDFMAC
jgi:hypothetical protein